MAAKQVARLREKPAAVRLREADGGRPPTVGPQSIGVVLTNACNLNCITCWSYSPLRRELPTIGWRRRRLTGELLVPFFQDAAAMGTERVIFTGGGDPLAHPEFYEIAGEARAAGLKITLISNVTLVRDRDRFVDLGIDTLLANFSSGDPESYAAFHPNRAPEDFERLLDTLRAVARGGTRIKLVFVVCSINAHVLPQAIAVAAELGASLQFKRVSVTEETQAVDLTEAQRTALLDQMEGLRGQAESVQVTANWEVFAAALRGEKEPGASTVDETGCWAGHFYSRVTASGDIYFCCNQHPDLRVGSLHDSSFAELWGSARYQEIRDRLRAGGFVSGCEQCGKLDLNHRVWAQLRTLPLHD